jgi:hypothetical protein
MEECGGRSVFNIRKQIFTLSIVNKARHYQLPGFYFQITLKKLPLKKF